MRLKGNRVMIVRCDHLRSIGILDKKSSIIFPSFSEVFQKPVQYLDLFHL